MDSSGTDLVVSDHSQSANSGIDQFTHLIRISNHLSRAPSIDELCKNAVQMGRELLGFERLSVWFFVDSGNLIQGSFGTDELGNVRDERHIIRPARSIPFVANLLSERKTITIHNDVPLRDVAGSARGVGDFGAAVMSDGEEIIGFVATDNLLHHSRLTDQQWRLLELFASLLGQLCTIKKTAIALRSSESILRVVLDTLPVGVWIMDNEQRIIDYNRAALDILDSKTPISSEEFRQYPATWAGSGEPIESSQWPSDVALQTGESQLNDEIELTTTVGNRKTILNSAVPLKDGDEQLGVVVVHHDITSRRQREKTLAAIATMSSALRSVSSQDEIVHTALRLLRVMVVTSTAAILTVDSETGQLTPVQAGGDLAEAGASDRQWLHDLYDRVVQTGVTASVLRDQITGRNGSAESAHIVCVPMFTQGTITGLLVTGHGTAILPHVQNRLEALADVIASALLRTDLYGQIATQASRLRSLIDAALIGLILLDANRRVIVANRSAEESLAIHGVWSDHTELLEIAGQPLTRLLQLCGEPQLISNKANRSVLEIEVTPLVEGDDAGGWVMTVQDVTAEHAMHERLQHHERMASVGQLAAGIAHDFNNIVAVIVLYVQMLQEGQLLDAVGQERLLVIRDQAQYASSLIRQILDFSRQTLLDPQPVNLEEFINETYLWLQRTLPENIAVQLKVVHSADQVPLDEEFVAIADTNSLRQVVTNLAVNARDAMVGGGNLQITLRRTTYATSDELPLAEMECGEWILICVADNGDGIQEDVLPHIFDPYFTTKGIGKGTGLGLAQVYGIVRQHNGQISVSSQTGTGSRFTIYLPAAAGPIVSVLDIESATVMGHQAQQGETILLVEDHKSARDATKAILEMLGYHVVAAKNGADGLHKFLTAGGNIKYVLSDMVMPKMGGMELYQELSMHNPDIKMLVMTGYPVEDGGRQLLETGIRSWIQKPFTIKELTNLLQDTFGY